MSDTYIIEVYSDAVGLVRDRGGFRFFSSETSFASLDGHLFPNPRAAEEAATRHYDTSNRGRRYRSVRKFSVVEVEGTDRY